MPIEKIENHYDKNGYQFGQTITYSRNKNYIPLTVEKKERIRELIRKWNSKLPKQINSK